MKTENSLFFGYNPRSFSFKLDSCCGGGNGHHEEGHKHAHGGNSTGNKFQCPMKCEGTKTYDKPGNCPVCNMKLTAVN